MAFEDWDKLLYGINRGECTLFLGPELPMLPPDSDPVQPIRLLTDQLFGQLRERGDDTPDLEPDNLPQVAQQFLSVEDDFALEMEVGRWHEGLAGKRSQVHEALAQLPFRRIVTSAHDPLMEAALRHAGKSPAVERYHYKGNNPGLLDEPTVDAPLLFHLYGHVGEPESVVLTDGQILDFLSALVSKDPPLPTDLDAALTEGRLFLFLGFGLRRWYLRILLHFLKVLRRRGRGFAIEPVAEGVGQPLSSTVLFYRDYKIDLLNEDQCDFAQQLQQHYAENADQPASTGVTRGGAGPVAGQQTRADAPTVFLCHASQDAAKAREIHEALERAGLQPWLDAEDLRGGDHWDALIESTIPDVDYFVVLNSQALLAKSQGSSYVNKEINVALRAKDLRLGTYIIPVQIDDTPLLDTLSDYHAVDLARPAGIRDLVRSIKRQARAG